MDNQIKFSKRISSPIGILIIVVFAVLVVGIFAWQFGGFKKAQAPEVIIPKEEVKMPEKKMVEDEAVDWKTCRNVKYGYEVKYPPSWEVWKPGPPDVRLATCDENLPIIFFLETFINFQTIHKLLLMSLIGSV